MKRTSFMKKHLKDNSGDGYIWLLFLTVALLLVFGALFTVMNNAMQMRAIRNDVDTAAEYVFKFVREDAYDKLTNGSTDYTYANLSDGQVLSLFGMYLGCGDIATKPGLHSWDDDPNFTYQQTNPLTTCTCPSGTCSCICCGGTGFCNNQSCNCPCRSGNIFKVLGSSSYVTKYDVKGRVEYMIENFYFDYVPAVYVGGKLIGDVNHNGDIDASDIALAQSFIDGENPSGITLSDVDVNSDGVANLHDLLMIKGLKKYWDNHKIKINSGWDVSTDSAFVMISFRLTVPIRYGTVDFGNDVDDYAFYSDLTFKPAQ